MSCYYESAEGTRVTRARAERELAKHGIDRSLEAQWAEFETFWAGRTSVTGQDLLTWLGY